MSKDPDISVRRWIKWSGCEAEESTSTLVLTSPKSNYVDIRVLLPSASNSPHGKNPPASTSQVLQNCGLVVASSMISNLDWAFAGTSSRTRATTESPAHGIWKRWVDSWEPNSKAHLLKDEGDLFPYYDGDEELELEKGNMLHQQTMRMTDYEELWAPGPAKGVTDGQKLCVVLKTCSRTGSHSDPIKEDSEARGMVIRVGQWIQGIVKRQDSVVVERWLQSSVSDTPTSSRSRDESQQDWRRVVFIRSTMDGEVELNLPCAAIMSSKMELSEGDELETTETNETAWRVEEVVRW